MREFCTDCGALVPIKRYELNYTTCMPCGELRARARRHTITPGYHKGPYMVLPNKTLLKDLSRPGTGLGGLNE